MNRLVDEIRDKIHQQNYQEAVVLTQMLPEQEKQYWLFHIAPLCGDLNNQVFFDPDDRLYDQAELIIEENEGPPELIVAAVTTIIRSPSLTKNRYSKYQQLYHDNIGKISDDQIQRFWRIRYLSQDWYRRYRELVLMEDQSLLFDALEQGLKEAQRIYELALQTDDPYIYGKAIYNISSMFFMMEDLSQTIELTKEYISIFEKQLDLPRMIYGYQSIAEHCYRIEQLDDAEVHYSRAITYATKIDNQKAIQEGLKGISEIYFFRGELEKALHYAMTIKQSNLDQTDFYGYAMLTNLLELILRIYLEMEDLNRANETLEEMRTLLQNPIPPQDHKVVRIGGSIEDYLLQLSQARYHIATPLIENQIQALPILKHIVTEYKKGYFEPAIYKQALLLLTELSIKLATFNNNIEEYNNAKHYLNLIEKLIKSQRGRILHIHFLRLQAKFYLIDGNLAEAIGNYEKAKDEARCLRLQHLHDKIELEIRQLEQELVYWKHIIEKNPDLNERIEKSRLREYINLMLRQMR